MLITDGPFIQVFIIFLLGVIPVILILIIIIIILVRKNRLVNDKIKEMMGYNSGLNVRCAEYASFGSIELAENAFEAMKERKAVFLANHGLLTGAKDILNAFNIAEEIEHCAEVYYRARSIGNPVLLSDEEMYKMIEKFGTYGQRKVKA